MTTDEKLDLIIEKLDRNYKVLSEILKLSKEDTPTREFLLNLGADLAGSIISGNR